MNPIRCTITYQMEVEYLSYGMVYMPTTSFDVKESNI